MKVHHKISRAVKAPQPGKVYGARVEGIQLNGSSITVIWAVFGRKNRRKGKVKA